MTEPTFPATVVDAVVAHMNGDHTEDNLMIVRAFGAPEATDATMIGLDGVAGIWTVQTPGGSQELRVDWPGGPITERPEIRREVVVLYDAACDRLGIERREH